MGKVRRIFQAIMRASVPAPAPRVPSPSENALFALGIPFKAQPDGTLLVEGDIDLCDRGLTALPDLSAVTVTGYFGCDGNELSTLTGAPRSVDGNFRCQRNRLTTLAGAPASVGGRFICYENELTSLEGAPRTVGGSFECHCNPLTSLQGAPTEVGGDFECFKNRLTSLAGAPRVVGGDFLCFHNKLVSLEHAPIQFAMLDTDFGEFARPEDIPRPLLVAPHLRAQVEEEERTKLYTLQHDVRVMRVRLRARSLPRTK